MRNRIHDVTRRLGPSVVVLGAFLGALAPLLAPSAAAAAPPPPSPQKASIIFAGAIDQESPEGAIAIERIMDASLKGVSKYTVVSRYDWVDGASDAEVDLAASLRPPAINVIATPLGVSAVLVAVVVPGKGVELQALDPKSGAVLVKELKTISPDAGGVMRLARRQAEGLVESVIKKLNVKPVAAVAAKEDKPPPPSGGGSVSDDLQRIEQQMKKLAAENAALREQARLREMEAAARLAAEGRKEDAAALEARKEQERASAAAREQDANQGVANKALQPTPADAPAGDDAEAAINWTEVTGRAGKLKLYGAVRVDAHFTDSPMNDPRLPMWVVSEGNPTFAAGADRIVLNSDNSTFLVHARFSRFGLDATSAPIEELFDARLSGNFEIDFNGGGVESRPLPRLRLFFGKLSWDPFYVLFGQAWDVSGPLIPTVNPGALMWNAGNVGDRQPQIQVGFIPKLGDFQLFAQAAVGQPESRTDADLDQSGIKDGDDATLPMLQGRLAAGWQHWVKDQPMLLGVWGFYSQQEFVLQSNLPVAVSPRETFPTYGFGVDLTLPLFDWLAIQGEGWSGRNMADMRGGIGQAIDLRTGFDVRAKGGWAEVKIKPLPFWVLSLGGGADSPNREDVNQRGKRALNTVLWLGNAFSFDGFRVGIDYTYWYTEWVTDNPGTANRLSLNLGYSF